MAEVKTQQIVEQGQDNICPLCSTTLKTSVCQECAAAIFPIIASNLQKKTNKKSPFQDVDNLVFQGGGVKGVAYLGVMKAFEKDYPNLLPNVKRIAGTSAGSMLALYLGLNKTPEQIEELLSGSDYSVLLDNGQEILVKQSSWVFFTKDYNFNAKEVILKAMGYLKNLEEMTKDEKVLRKQLVDIFTQVFTYLLSKIGFGTKVTMELFGSWFIHFLANWLLGVIFPASEKSDETTLDKQKFINQCQDATAIAIENVQKRQKELEETGELPKEPISDSPRDIPKSHPSELDNNEILLCAVAELIWQLFRGKKEGDAQEVPIGLFTAEKVKQDLMITPIYDSLKAINKHTEYKAEEITFAEIASLRNQKGDLAFRPFYVCAFNTATFRTDVFSVDHSPNVVVADAIRASMSIPLFFQSVPIREKIGGVLQERRAYNCAHEGGVKILYMDGGIMDNYPIWIFDDLKYCLDDKAIPNWQRDQRVGMQNPNTLGCKLLDIDRIDIYQKPYKDQMREKAKLVQDAANIGSYFAVIKFLIKIEFNEHEESAHAQRGDYFRTIYVYDCKISAVDFALNPKQKDMLISSGSLAVDFFRERANKSFEGEIGTLLPKNAERK